MAVSVEAKSLSREEQKNLRYIESELTTTGSISAESRQYIAFLLRGSLTLEDIAERLSGTRPTIGPNNKRAETGISKEEILGYLESVSRL